MIVIRFPTSNLVSGDFSPLIFISPSVNEQRFGADNKLEHWKPVYRLRHIIQCQSPQANYLQFGMHGYPWICRTNSPTSRYYQGPSGNRFIAYCYLCCRSNPEFLPAARQFCQANWTNFEILAPYALHHLTI